MATSRIPVFYHRAAEKGDARFVRELLASQAPGPNDVDLREPLHGWCALHLAVARNHLDVVRLLIEQGASPDVRDNQGETPLHYACTVVSTVPTDARPAESSFVTAADAAGSGTPSVATPTTACADASYAAMLRVATRNGRDELEGLSTSGRLETTAAELGPAAAATRQGSAAAAAAQEEEGEEEGREEGGQEGEAGKAEEEAAVVQERKREEPSNMENGEGSTVDLDAEPEATAFEGPPLSLSVVEMLLEANADIHAVDDKEGATPLHLASRHGSEETMRSLLDAGADPIAEVRPLPDINITKLR